MVSTVSRSVLTTRFVISSHTRIFQQLVHKMSNDASKKDTKIQFDSFGERLERLRARTAVQTDFRPPNYATALLPTLHSDSFDTQGRKIHPWVIPKVFDHLDMSWPQYREAPPPDEPKAGIYILKLQIDVAPELYDLETPLHPLLLESQLVFLRRSSRCYRNTMRHPDSTNPYATMTGLDVNVDLETRRPIPYPDSWRDPSIPSQSPASVLDFDVPVKPGDTIKRQRQVYQSDNDENGHTNYTSYIRFCHDCFVDNINERKYKRNAAEQLEAGVKQIQVVFKSECLRGDSLDIESWEDAHEEGTYHFELNKGKELVVALTLRFFGAAVSEMKSKI